MGILVTFEQYQQSTIIMFLYNFKKWSRIVEKELKQLHLSWGQAAKQAADRTKSGGHSFLPVTRRGLSK